MRLPILFYCLLCCSIAGAQQKIGIFSAAADVGHPITKGTAHYDKKTKEYYINGGGYNIWFQRDEFHYLYKPLTGDFVFTANMKLLGEGKELHRKIGFMLRESLEDSAMHISATIHGDGLTALQWRTAKGAAMRDPEDEIFSTQKNIDQIEVERKGDLIIFRAAGPNEVLQEVGRHQMPGLPAAILAGIFLCSHNSEVLEQGKAWRLTLKN
jgi:TolB protein